jgi:hypothetical protein
MKEAEFMQRLEEGLGKAAGREEILADYRLHFEEGRADGRSEEDIARALGDPRILAREFRIEAGEEAQTWAGRRRLLIPALALGAVFLIAGGIFGIRAAESERRAREAVHVNLPGGLEISVSGAPAGREGHGLAGGSSVDSSGLPVQTGSLVPLSIERRLGLEGIDALEIDAEAADLRVRIGRGKELVARLSGKVGEQKKDGIRFEANSGGGRANLRVETDNAFIFGYGSLSLEVELPASYGEELELRSGSGDIVAEGVGVRRIAAESVSGSVTVKGSGGELRLKTGSGDIAAEPRKMAAASLESGSGDIELIIPAGAALDYRAESGSGEVVVAGQELGEGAHSGRMGGGGPAVELRAGSGEVRLGS